MFFTFDVTGRITEQILMLTGAFKKVPNVTLKTAIFTHFCKAVKWSHLQKNLFHAINHVDTDTLPGFH